MGPDTPTTEVSSVAALQGRRWRAGLLLGLGALLAGVMCAGWISADWDLLDPRWASQRPLLLVAAGLLMVLGVRVATWPGRIEDSWRPTVPGRRFRRLIVYSRKGCHLCDIARDQLAEYARYLPEIEVINIDTDPDLRQRFDTEVPVVEIDGQIRFRGRISEVLLRRLIEGTAPGDRPG